MLGNNEEGRAYMRRALQLSLEGGPNVSPNPFVGAVIVADGRIIGEGYHRFYGKAHAEVNAVDWVKEADRPLLARSTMYVTLEPCSHFGKTPPCADLVIRTGIPRVVVATEDPFLKDYESGIDRMRNAGVEVEVGLMREEARFINRRFFSAHTLRRPYVLLKWAESADGFIAADAPEGGATGHHPVALSTPLTRVLMHRERSLYDAILVGVNTVLADSPRLDCRLWPSRACASRPLKLTFGSPRLPAECRCAPGDIRGGYVTKSPDEPLDAFLGRLYSDFGIISLMVEGGSATLESFISEGLFDEVRVESSPMVLGSGLAAPDISRLHLPLLSRETVDGNLISRFLAGRQTPIAIVKNY